MKQWEPWAGLASGIGLVVMLIGAGFVDAAGFVIAAAPLIYGLIAWLRYRKI